MIKYISLRTKKYFIMKKYCFLLLFGVIYSLSNIYAQNVSLDKAKCIAELFMKESTALGEEKTSVSSKHVSTFTTKDGTPSIYVFNLDEGGFVLVSAENRVKPILAYSTKGYYDASNVADGFYYTISSYNEEIEYVRNNRISATQDIISEWETVEKSGRISEKRNRTVVEPLVETTWNQNYPYNMLCPEDELGNGGHVYAGCVATAMAQVMRYWNHPVNGYNSHTYTPYGYPTQTANFSETTYNFENMPLYVDSLSTEEEIYDIALLQWHCGIAVDMMYGNDGSGAYSDDVPQAISQYFGYNYGRLEYHWDYSNEQWAEALKSELDQSRPLYYSGQDDNGNGGHAFVCDGYDENDYFHFNWGWGGRDDAYCAIGALNTTKYAFNWMNAAIFDFYPRTDYYFSRPERVSDMNITEIEGENSVLLSWTNPTLNMDGETLSSIEKVFVRRDFTNIAVLTDVEPGETMTFTDEIGEPGLYEYSIYATNDIGNGKPLYQTILVGDKCNLLFEMNDEGGDGWKGGSISVFNDNQRIAVITLHDGASLTEEIPLLKGDLTFVWNKCWYKDQYYTCDEVSFKIKDLEGNVLYEDGEDIEPGILFEYNNDCISCARPNNLRGEYVMQDGSFGAKLYWNLNSDNVQKFNIYRSLDNSNYELIAEVNADTQNVEYEYYNEENEIGSYYYKVMAYYDNSGETCESEPALTEYGDDFVMIDITSLADMMNDVKIYPNPTEGKFYVQADNIKEISVYNLVGQEIISYIVDNDNCTIDLSNFDEGIYFVKINTSNNSLTKRLILAY